MASRPHPDHPCRQPGAAAQADRVLRKIEDRQPYDQAAYEACLKQSIEEVVQQQADAGIDIVSDGEFSKGRNWAFYVHDRLTGVTTRSLTAEEAKDPMASVGRRSGPRRVPRVLRRIRPGFRTGQAARLALRGQRAADLLRRPGQTRHRQPQGRRRQGQGRGRLPSGGRAGKRAAERQERAISGREEPVVGARRLPAPGIQGNRRCRPLRADRRRLPAVHARKDGAADDPRAVSRVGADAHRRPQPRAQGHPAGALALSHLLGQLERPARLRRADEGHRRSHAAGERRAPISSRPPIRATSTNGWSGDRSSCRPARC